MQRIRVFTVLLLVAAGLALAQVDTGKIAGVVRDASGAVINGAQITVHNGATGWDEKLATNGEGLFVSPPLSPGEYDVEVTASGFAKVIQHLRLEVAQRASLEVALKPGEVKEEVTVQGAEAQLATDTSTL